MNQSVEQALAILEKREAETRAASKACVKRYLAMLADPNVSPAALAHVAAVDCGFTAADVRTHLAELSSDQDAS